jgi:hypothetical protein
MTANISPLQHRGRSIERPYSSEKAEEAEKVLVKVEEYPMLSIEDVRRLVQASQSKIRRNLIVIFITGGLLLLVSAVAIMSIPRPSARIISAGIVVLTLVLVYLLFSRVWVRRPASPEASIRGCVDFYRKELEAQYRAVQLSWRLLVVLAVFAFLTLNAVLRPNPLGPKILVLSVLLLSILARLREAREIRRRLTALEAFEKDQ